MNRVGARNARPVILEQNHIGNADIFPVTRKNPKFLLKFRADGQWPPLPDGC